MSLDLDHSGDTTSASNASTEPVDTAADTASQGNDTQTADDSSDTASHGDQQSDESGSTTSPDTTLQTADPKQEGSQGTVDWQAERAKYEKRIADLRAGHSRSANELHQFRQRYKDIDPDAARKALELHKQTQHPVWSPKHPEHQSFRETKAAFARYEAAMRKADTPEKRAYLQETLGSSFTEKEVQQLQEWRNHQQMDAERRASDPEYEREQRRAEMREELRQELQAQREEAEVATWFSNAANQAVVDRYRDEMIGLMNEGWAWNQVQRYIEAKSKADGLQSRVGTADKTAAAARAQSDALKSKATTQRDAAQASIGKMDFAKIGADYAKKQGLPLTHERVLAHVEKAVQNWRASNPS